VELKIAKIIFGEPKEHHFVTFHSGEHETPVIGDRNDIYIEVMVPTTVKIQDVEATAIKKAKRFIKELANAL